MRRISTFIAAALTFTGAAVMSGQNAATPATPNLVRRVVGVTLYGIALTDAEKASLKGVGTHYAPMFATIGQETKPIVSALRAARQAHDTAAAHAARLRLQGEREKGVTVLRSALTDIRGTLTPAQQRQFDQNLAFVRQSIRRRLDG